MAKECGGCGKPMCGHCGQCHSEGCLWWGPLCRVSWVLARLQGYERRLHVLQAQLPSTWDEVRRQDITCQVLERLSLEVVVELLPAEVRAAVERVLAVSEEVQDCRLTPRVHEGEKP